MDLGIIQSQREREKYTEKNLKNREKTRVNRLPNDITQRISFHNFINRIFGFTF